MFLQLDGCERQLYYIIILIRFKKKKFYYCDTIFLTRSFVSYFFFFNSEQTLKGEDCYNAIVIVILILFIQLFTIKTLS